MKISDKIKEQNSIIESINQNIDSILNEGLIGDLTSLVTGGVPGLIRKKIIKKAIGSALDELNTQEKEKKELEKNKDLNKDEIDNLKKEIDDLKKQMEELIAIENEEIPLKKVIINFNSKTSLDIEKLYSPEYKRNILGTMYFSVIDYNESNNVLELKTSSFPDTLRLHLEIEDLKTNKDQKGKMYLIYNKYGKTTSQDIKGEEKDVYFKFLKII